VWRGKACGQTGESPPGPASFAFLIDRLWKIPVGRLSNPWLVELLSELLEPRGIEFDEGACGGVGEAAGLGRLPGWRLKIRDFLGRSGPAFTLLDSRPALAGTCYAALRLRAGGRAARKRRRKWASSHN